MKGYTFKTTFDEVADLYDEVRPDYPTEIIEAIIKSSSLPDNAAILEVGPGTGQITLPFAEQGYQILGLELGENLAQVARRKFANFPKVTVETTALEDWTIQTESFDLFLSAQAFHWIKPDIGLSIAHQSLKQGGSIALVWHLDMSHTTEFYKATTPLFDKYVPTDASRPNPPGSVKLYRDALETSKLFSNLKEHFVDRELTYAKSNFIKLLDTFSPHRRLESSIREAFYAEIEELIDAFGGAVTRLYRTALLLSAKEESRGVS